MYRERLFADDMLLEAITNQYYPNYLELKKQLSRVGSIHVVSCNYSQYSSRYDAFKRGEVLPAFNADMAGGALMDLNAVSYTHLSLSAST